jgi:hypothetical protein
LCVDGADGRGNRSGGPPGAEAQQFLVDDVFCMSERLLEVGVCSASGRLDLFERVEGAAAERACRCFDVAWYGEVDQADGSCRSRLKNSPDLLSGDEGARRARCRDGGVHPAEYLWDTVERHGFCAECAGQRHGSTKRPIGDEGDPGAAHGELTRAECRDPAGADHQRGPTRKSAQRPVDRFSGRDRERDRSLAEPGFGASPFPGAEGVAEEGVEDRPRSAARVCLAYLAEDLPFSEHDRVEPGRDSVQVPHCVSVVFAVDQRP